MVGLVCFIWSVLVPPFKSKSRLEAENAALRHQVTVLRRQIRGRVRLNNFDRTFLVQLYRWCPSILRVFGVVRPETVIRWHRYGFRSYWRWKCRGRGGRPPINALDQAAPLAGWSLPEEFATLRRLLEARMGKHGKREFVQVLRLMEVFRADEVAAAVRDTIARGAIGFDAVKHLVLCHIERRPPRLDMTVYPYLPRAQVAMTSAKAYLSLLTGAAP